MSYMQHYDDSSGEATIRRAPGRIHGGSGSLGRPPALAAAELVGEEPEASQVRRVHVNQIFLRHPRSILVLACVQLCLGVQLTIFGMICRFYDGCRYATGIWCGVIFCINATLGILLVKAYPKMKMLYIYLVTTLVSCILSLTIFIILACHLDSEERFLNENWDPERKRYKNGINRLIESTKIAMYAIQLVISASHGICVIISAVLCYLNIWCGVPEGEVHKAYYVTQSPYGNQTTLYPMEVTNSPPESVPLLLVDKVNSGTQTAQHSQV